ncbi:hypothetical protein BDF20DRAFT_834399 [Mycotypha africana]|uniref:uncharacterized protein n=1 Tax=Mycotypha africana TaxID=64632 RepID=UPI002300B3A2|nr:uncharacterized protein BDF20DRAFT_834399 [Mycotypha africana]KAI8981709.1 hypothetical protein BDF20DRAFT_834399 [Mycotypha africana]
MSIRSSKLHFRLNETKGSLNKFFQVYFERIPFSRCNLLVEDQIIHNDFELQNILAHTPPGKIIHAKLMKTNTALLIAPVTRNITVSEHANANRNNVSSATITSYNNDLRRDSGIAFFEQDLIKFTINKKGDNNSNKRGSSAYISPATTPTPTYHNSPVLPSQNTDNSENNTDKVRLPGVHSLLFNNNSHYYQHPSSSIPSSSFAPMPPTPPTPPLPFITTPRRSSYCPPTAMTNATPYLQQYNSRRHSAASIVHQNKLTSSTTKLLKRQLQQHTFICDHVVDSKTGERCSQSFRRSYDLSRHQTIHLKNRPFCLCHFCGKKFTRLDALRRHERIQGHVLH